MVKQEILELHTRGNCHMVNITDDVDRLVRASQIMSGTVTLFVPGATGAITTIEFESGLERDMNELMEKLIPQSKEYHHNLKWGDTNGHSHLRASLMGPSLTIPFYEGQMTLGIWQQIVFLDFDNRSRSRRIVIQIMGE